VRRSSPLAPPLWLSPVHSGNRFLTAKTDGDPKVAAAKTTLLIPCSVGGKAACGVLVPCCLLPR
jgi:hypothetical protein